jgi:NADH-quinone oxidoreductase subunit M
MLWMYQRVMFGPLDKPENKVLKDLNFREVIILLAMTAIIFWIGIYPRPFLSRLEASSYNVLKQVQRPAQETIINVGEDPSSQGEAK